MIDGSLTSLYIYLSLLFLSFKHSLLEILNTKSQSASDNPLSHSLEWTLLSRSKIDLIKETGFYRKIEMQYNLSV